MICTKPRNSYIMNEKEIINPRKICNKTGAKPCPKARNGYHFI